MTRQGIGVAAVRSAWTGIARGSAHDTAESTATGAGRGARTAARAGAGADDAVRSVRALDAVAESAPTGSRVRVA